MESHKKGSILSSYSDFKGLPEIFENLYNSESITIERIITNGAISTSGKWYDQEGDEWVILIQGTATLEFSDKKTKELKSGEYILIPAHCKHRVIKTSDHPNCIWLAIHIKNN